MRHPQTVFPTIQKRLVRPQFPGTTGAEVRHAPGMSDGRTTVNIEFGGLEAVYTRPTVSSYT
jgi:hypothetical protein